MMFKSFLVALMALVFIIPSNEVKAMDIVGVQYDFNAVGAEPALTIEYSQGLKSKYPDLVFKADQFQLLPGEKTIADIEARITAAVMDRHYTITPLSQLEADDGAKQTPPRLQPNEEIIGNKVYWAEYYFAIHIFSIEPIEIQGNVYQRQFITRFQQGQWGPIPEDWWVE